MVRDLGVRMAGPRPTNHNPSHFLTLCVWSGCVNQPGSALHTRHTALARPPGMRNRYANGGATVGNSACEQATLAQPHAHFTHTCGIDISLTQRRQTNWKRACWRRMNAMPCKPLGNLPNTGEYRLNTVQTRWEFTEYH